MSDITQALIVVAALANPIDISVPKSENWCTPGYTVMLPDGREGVVTSIDGEICRVVTDGEKYVTPMPHFILEPVYPQLLAFRDIGH
jgi:hypothetical protein